MSHLAVAEVLFVGTKRAAAEKFAETGSELWPSIFVNHRWLGGMLTNWTTVSQSIRRLRELESRFESGEINQLTKKEVLQITREQEKLERTLGGIKGNGRHS
jgi:small subunit ribosomal protein S2